MLESTVEDHFLRAADCRGVWAIKGENVPGFPDRICLAHPGRVAFAELKRPGKGPRPLQERTLKRLRRLGFVAWSIDTKEDADAFFQEWLG